MDARTEHLIAMVTDGATLEDAGRAYGIGRERVRQILKGEGIRAKELRARAQKRGSRGSRPPRGVEAGSGELPREFAPVVEVMWREGMLYHEIAEVFESSCEAVHRLICERVSPPERPSQAVGQLEDGRCSDNPLVDGVRKAADILAASPAIDGDDRRHAQAAINGWLAARSELIATPAAGSPTERSDAVDATPPAERLTPAELRNELDRFKAELRAAGLRASTIHLYLVGSSLFVRWLAGDYVPGSGRRADRAPAGGAGLSS